MTSTARHRSHSTTLTLRAAAAPLLAALVSLAMPGATTAAGADPEGSRLPAAHTRLPSQRVHPAATAVVRMSDLARSDAARPAWEGALAPLAILQGEQQPEAEVEEPLTERPIESYAFPAPGLAALVPSPLPAQSFIGLDDIPRIGTATMTIPPDVDGAVGPSHILEGLNNNYRTFDKATGAVLSTVSITSFWSAAGGSGYFDPKTLYDPVQQRWIVAALSDARLATSSILVGVSQTSDPTGAWTLFRVRADTTGVNWADFPCVGFNKNWIAVNVNLFSVAANAGAGAKCLILDYAQARAGSLVGTVVEGTGFCSAPAATYSAAEPTLYVPTHLSSASGTYRLDTITGTPASPVYTVGATRARGLNWTQPGGAILPQAPPLTGTSFCGATPCQVESQDAQLRSTPVYRSGSIWYAQTVGLPAGGLTHTGVQWTRLDAATGNVLDGGRIEDPGANATNGGNWYAYAHVAVNAAGDALLSFTQFSSAQFASAGYAFRFAADGAGTLREPQIYKTGEDYYHKNFGAGRNRWGDYSKAQVDPSDDRSLWVVAEYARARVGADDGDTGANSSRWGTWWARVGPAVIIDPGPSLTEGNTGSTPFNVTVRLTMAMASDVTVTYGVADGSATTADGDYTSSGTSVVIPAGSLSADIPLAILGDPVYEPDETFTVTLTGVTGATGVSVGTASTATVTIVNDDPLPSVSVSDTSSTEGNSGTATQTFRVSLSNPSSQLVTVDWAVHDGTAKLSDDDYVNASGTASFLPGVLTRTVAVSVVGDVYFESNETYTLDLVNPVNASIADASGTGTIVNDDAQPSLSITTSASVAEGDAGATAVPLSVTISGPSGAPVTVGYQTHDGTAKASNNDYVAASGTLTFPARSTAAQPLSVSVVGDVTLEADEAFTVGLANASGASVANGTATVTIVNDEGVPALSIANASTAEGNSGTSTLRFVVSLTHPSDQPVTAHVATLDGTATVADGDYVGLSGGFTVPAFAASDTVRVTVNGDLRCEPTEQFVVRLSAVVGAAAADTEAVGQIGNDDECVPPAVSVLSPNGGETLVVGSVAALTWLATDAVGVTGVDVLLSRNNGGTFTTLASGEANDGSFDWTVTGPATAQARLRVVAHDAAGNAGSDMSNAAWSIGFPSTAVNDEPVTEFALTRISPNPAVQGTQVEYALPREARVRLTIADLQGRTLAVLVDGVRPAGRHAARWEAAAARAGIYFVRMEAGGHVAARRFAVTR